MSNYKKGKEYENFVETVYTAVIEAEKRDGRLKAVKLARNITLPCKSSATAEFDIYWEYKVAGLLLKIAIECKNYNKLVGVDDIREFIGKVSSVGGITGVMITKMGFTENAKNEATFGNIQLLIIREQNNDDWNGFLKIFNIVIHAIMPSQTLNIEPTINKQWLAESGYKKGDSIQIQGSNDLIFIEESSSNFRHSLIELERSDFFSSKDPGTYTWVKLFKEDGWLILDKLRLKIDSIKITYIKPNPVITDMCIDFSNYVSAIMEIIEENKKTAIMKNGTLKDFSFRENPEG